MIHDLEDNYPEYEADQQGYAFDAWDVLSLAEMQRHDAFRDRGVDTLEDVDLEALSDLDRWAVARSFRDAGDVESFLVAARLIAESKDEHPALRYDEVVYAIVSALAPAQKFDEATLLLDSAAERWPDSLDLKRLAGITKRQQNRSEGDRLLDELAEAHPDDPELAVDVAQDLIALGDNRAALKWLSVARDRASDTGKTAVLVDIELLETGLDVDDDRSTEE